MRRRYPMPDRSVLKALANAFVSGDQTVERICLRLIHVLGRRWGWVRPLAKRYSKAFSRNPNPRQREVIKFVQKDAGFQRAWSRYSSEIALGGWLRPPEPMRPIAAAFAWQIPAITSVGELAEWLGLTSGELEWFADLHNLGFRLDEEKLQLKAVLTNCARKDPEQQNREGHADFRQHLEGRVAFVEHINPVRGRKLRELLGQVRW